MAVQKLFLLQKPQEHQPINQHRGIPAQVLAGIGDARNKYGKRFALVIELGVKLLGDFVAVKSCHETLRHAKHGKGFFIIQLECNGAKFLAQQFCRFALAPRHFPVLVG